METFKILKFDTPVSMKNLMSRLSVTEKLRLRVPLVKLDIAKQNYAFQASHIWNELSVKVFEKCKPTESGLIIPGSSKNSDLSASSASIKKNLKSHLLSRQKSRNPLSWE